MTSTHAAWLGIGFGLVGCTPHPNVTLLFPDTASEQQANQVYVAAYPNGTIPGCDQTPAASPPPPSPITSIQTQYPLSPQTSLGNVPRGTAQFYAQVTDQYSLPFLRACSTQGVPGNVTLSLVRVPRPPVILEPSSNPSVKEGATALIAIHVGDPDGAGFTISVSTLPRFATFDGAMTITCKPGPPDQGVYPITITATSKSPTHPASSKTIQLTVIDVPRQLAWNPLYRGWRGRFEAGAIFDPATGVFFVFGGRDGGVNVKDAQQPLDYYSAVDSLDDMRFLTTSSAAWTPVTITGTWPAPGFSFPFAIINSTTGAIGIMSSGTDGVQLTGDTWTLTIPSSGPPLWNHPQIGVGAFPLGTGIATATDPSRSDAYIFGGDISLQLFSNDTSQVLAPNIQNIDVNMVLATGVLPPPRTEAAAVYATNSPARVVIIGGRGPDPTSTQTPPPLIQFNDAWMLCIEQGGTLCPQANVWTQLPTTSGCATGAMSPCTFPAMYEMSAGYDAVNERVLIFGGLGVEQGTPYLYQDLWELNLDPTATQTWTKFPEPSPEPLGLVGAATAVDPVHHQMIMYGGITGSYVDGNPVPDLSDDVWVLSMNKGAEALTQLITTGTAPYPIPRVRHTAIAPTPSHGALVLGGGTLSGFANDIWEQTPAGAMTILNPSGSNPWPRTDYTATYVPDRNEVWLFGGRTQTALESPELYRLSLVKGAETFASGLISDSTLARSSHSAAYDAQNQRLIIFGGQGCQTSCPQDLSDVVAITLDSSGAPQEQRLNAGSTPARYGQVAGYDSFGQRMIIYGGTVYSTSTGTENDANDVWQLSLTPGSEKWQQINPSGTPPPAMFYPKGVLTAENPPKLYVMGTVSRPSLDFVDGLWVLDLTPGAETWTPLPAISIEPSTRFTAAVTYDPVQNVLLMSAGIDDFITRNDLWALTLP
jgi:hypothetical protein